MHNIKNYIKEAIEDNRPVGYELTCIAQPDALFDDIQNVVNVQNHVKSTIYYLQGIGYNIEYKCRRGGEDYEETIAFLKKGNDWVFVSGYYAVGDDNTWIASFSMSPSEDKIVTSFKYNIGDEHDIKNIQDVINFVKSIDDCESDE